MASGKQVFDNTLYGSSGNSATSGKTSFMGSPAQIAQHFGFNRKKPRNNARKPKRNKGRK